MARADQIEDAEGGATTRLVRSMLRKVDEIKRQHPELSRSIDRQEAELRKLMEEIRDDVRGILVADRELKLMTVYLINLVHKAIDEVLAD